MLAHLFERLLLVWLCMFGLAAYFWARWFPGIWDPFLASKPVLNYFFMATMFAVGSLLPKEELAMVFRRWPTVLGGTAVQFAVMPFLGWSLAGLFGLDEATRVGIILVGCVPGAMASNVLTMLARGNVSYSVSLTTSATLLSPIIVPFGLWLCLGKHVNFPIWQISYELALMVVLPVAAGHLLSRYYEPWRRLARSIASIAANLCILWIISVVVAVNREAMTEIDLRLFWALLVLNLLGYLGGWLGALAMRLPFQMRRALTLEVGMQNAGLGTVLALRMFGDYPAAAIPPAIYTFGCMFTGTILARCWAEFSKNE
ncbi:MAG: bile acid:sodium symporter family protein [Thermoguttaceae bacterium]